MLQQRVLRPEEFLVTLHRHPRVAYQHVLSAEADLLRLSQNLRPLVAFGEAHYARALAVLDWDHRLPSQVLVLRIAAYYTQSAWLGGQAEVQARTAQILARDAFPEFDLPDYEGLWADEAYEAEVAMDGTVERLRLVSPWRRDVLPSHARSAVRAVRSSPEFHEVLEQTKTNRAQHLGDLEAMGWVPPCESGGDDWTIDVWYMTHLDAMHGQGHSFLFNPQTDQIDVTREFMIRS